MYEGYINKYFKTPKMLSFGEFKNSRKLVEFMLVDRFEPSVSTTVFTYYNYLPNGLIESITKDDGSFEEKKL